MKKEQLLEAIGYADEQFLMETETVPRRSGFRMKYLGLIAAIVAVITVTAMASTGFFGSLLKGESNGSSVSNLATGMGNFVYTADGIYHGVPGFIYKCDFEGTVVKTYPLGDELETPHYMFAVEDAIVYVNSMGVPVEPADETAPTREDNWGLRVLPLDGAEPYSICPGVSVTHAFADGNQLYTTNGATMLSKIDLVTLEKTDLLENVHSYYVDDTYIYAVQSENANCYYRSRKDTIRFEQISVSFYPNKILADGEDLYICEWMNEEDQKETKHRYRVNLIRNGETTALPVYSWFYQVLDGNILYREEETYALKCYEVSTGEVTTLAENVFEFSVLEDRYICIDEFNTDPVIYDWLTGESTKIDISK